MTKKIQSFLGMAAILLATGCSRENKTNQIVLKENLKWQRLNPARGEKSPKAATLWGNRNGTGPTGFLVQFNKGFSSPPHIHNVSYRGVVISGLIHNDDTHAATMSMPTGSYWAQPKGEIHITAANGEKNIAFIEIEDGPYLVHPAKDAFDAGERPVNIHSSNIVWQTASGTNHMSSSSQPSANFAQIALLWRSTQKSNLYGTLLKLPINFNGKILTSGSIFYAVVIKGNLKYQHSGKEEKQTLEPGSLFSSKGFSKHKISSVNQEEIIFYIRTDGEYKMET